MLLGRGVAVELLSLYICHELCECRPSLLKVEGAILINFTKDNDSASYINGEAELQGDTCLNDIYTIRYQPVTGAFRGEVFSDQSAYGFESEK